MKAPTLEFSFPEHVQIVGYALADQLGLRGVPERIVCRGRFELFERVEIRTLIARVLLQGFLRPLLE